MFVFRRFSPLGVPMRVAGGGTETERGEAGVLEPPRGVEGAFSEDAAVFTGLAGALLDFSVRFSLVFWLLRPRVADLGIVGDFFEVGRRGLEAAERDLPGKRRIYILNTRSRNDDSDS